MNPLLDLKASVKMDGVSITNGEVDVPQALQHQLKVCFLFCVEYPEQINTLSFIQLYLFKIGKGKKKVSIPVLKMYIQL